MSRRLDLTGFVFNRLTVLSYNGVYENYVHKWNCICNCGVKCVVSTDNLRRNHTQSCGCLQSERSKYASTKHGHSGPNTASVEYKTWVRMKVRCYNNKCSMYYAYGGRGIKVCDRWLNSFKKFSNDIGYRPSNRHSIERIDVNDGYSPSNCKWATIEQQAQNKRNNRKIELNGIEMNISQWAKRLNTTDCVIRKRINRGQQINYDARAKKYINIK